MTDDERTGRDGTPGWAYDEDGYCVRCGNGRWKHHMPDCELRDALELADRMATALEAASECLGYHRSSPCHYCGGERGGRDCEDPRCEGVECAFCHRRWPCDSWYAGERAAGALRAWREAGAPADTPARA